MHPTRSKKEADVKSIHPKRQILEKIIDDKKSLNQYFMGEISINELNARGIKFVKPI